MTVTEAVNQRRSIRAFLDRPVDMEVLRGALETAARAPSGGNLQPWRLVVLSGQAMRRFKELMRRRVTEAPGGEGAEYDVYPPKLHEPYRTRRFELGEAMYALLGIPREDRAARLVRFAENFQFFGAPVGLFCFVDRRMGPPQWSDLGMYLQTLMLLLVEAGLASCPQEAWSSYHRTVAEQFSVPDELMLFCGMAIGYADPAAAVNRLVSERAPLEELVRFVSD